RDHHEVIAEGFDQRGRACERLRAHAGPPVQKVDADLHRAPRSGRRCAHGCAASNAAEARSTVTSSKRRPTICRPIGKPAFVKPQGTVAAGCPVMLKM